MLWLTSCSKHEIVNVNRERTENIIELEKKVNVDDKGKTLHLGHWSVIMSVFLAGDKFIQHVAKTIKLVLVLTI